MQGGHRDALQGRFRSALLQRRVWGNGGCESVPTSLRQAESRAAELESWPLRLEHLLSGELRLAKA
jgi:hypothetical protein